MPEIYRFDRFELRPAERVLLADGKPQALGSRAFDLLACLVGQRDRVLTKGELLEQVWPGQVVEENNLSVHVLALRKVLGAGAIVTVSGRGYRFTLPVEPAPQGHAAPPAAPSPTVAVLPLDVLSDNPRIAFFAQGLAEDVTALLSRVPGFFVIAHASSSLFRGRQETPQAAAQQLGVRYLVQGSVRPRAGSLRVSLQLVEAASARILWTAQFDSEADDATDAQEQIARGIISQLEPELTRAQIAHIRRQRPDNLDAWAHYHEAVGALATEGWTPEGMAAAREALRRSCALDQKFDEGIERMRYGMRLSPRDRRLGFWRWALGGFLLRVDRVDEALAEARLACQADPRFHLAYVLLAAIFDRQGAGEAAVDALREARQRRPQLSLEEVKQAHGRRISERLALIWGDSERPDQGARRAGART